MKRSTAGVALVVVVIVIFGLSRGQVAGLDYSMEKTPKHILTLMEMPLLMAHFTPGTAR